MKARKFAAVVPLIILFVLMLPAAAFAAEEGATAKRAGVLNGTPPVGINIGSSGTLPEDVWFTSINASFSDKHRAKDGGGNKSDYFSQFWIYKIRYGITSELEFVTLGTYANNSYRNPTPSTKHIEGYGDQSIGLTYAFFNGHQGDPLSMSAGLTASVPTAPRGDNHVPGAGVWGGRASFAIGGWLMDDLKVDTEFSTSMAFERGNQDVKRGQQYSWSTQFRYVFNEFDLGLESSVIKAESGDVHLPGGGNRNLRNGYTEWYVGPSVNVAFDKIDAWLGVGVFFPMYQHVEGPSKVDNARLEFKFAKLW